MFNECSHNSLVVCSCDVIRWKHDCKSGGVVLVTAKATGRGAKVRPCGMLAKAKEESCGREGKTKCEEQRK